MRPVTERSVPLVLVVAAFAFAAATFHIASVRPLWYDELFTLYLSRLPDAASLWKALLSGADQMPIGFHLITRAFNWVPGSPEIAIRQPALLGYLLAGLGLYSFAARRLPRVYAGCAAIFPLVTAAATYSVEARAYGLLLGLGALSLVCWQRAAEGRHRTPTLLGLTLSLALAISCQYYAVLLLLPIGVGELARRRLDLPVWGAMLASLTVLLPLWPHIQSAKTFSNHFWNKPTVFHIVTFYLFLLLPAVLSLITLAAVAMALYRWRKVAPVVFKVPRYELAAAFAFLAIPAAAVAMGILVTGAFANRYALATVLGVALLFADGAAKLFQQDTRAGGVLLAVLLVCAGGTLARESHDAFRQREALQELTSQLSASTSSGTTVAIADAHTYLALVQYAPRELRSRIVYIRDLDRALTRVHSDSVERVLPMLQCCTRLTIEDYTSFVAQHPRFWVYEANDGTLQWLVPELRDSGLHVDAPATVASGRLYAVKTAVTYPSEPLRQAAQYRIGTPATLHLQ